MTCTLAWTLLFASAFPLALSAQQQPSSLVQQQQTLPVFDRAKAATVVILAGEGAGRLRSVASGVLISKDGVILTALHAIKGAQEVQVRLSNGEMFDHVELLDADERRDVAAVKIAASGLPALTPGEVAGVVQGTPVYAVTNSGALTFSATQGIVSAIRPAEEVPGAGTGFRLVQFTAPVAPGSSGGALVDASGNVIGIITGAKGNAAFAVPIDSVIGLASSNHRIPLGSGAALQLPAKSAADTPQSSAAIEGANPKAILKNAKTVYIHSKTSFLTVDTLDRALLLEKNWGKLGLTIVQDQRVADVLIEMDRPSSPMYTRSSSLTRKLRSSLAQARSPRLMERLPRVGWRKTSPRYFRMLTSNRL